ncbi:hypothetical protein IFT45_11040 [Frigoribacterium sp. CFBP 13707]|nr:hypothetical protein [Frigoribacterium sp. CFBP 13707]
MADHETVGTPALLSFTARPAGAAGTTAGPAGRVALTVVADDTLPLWSTAVTRQVDFTPEGAWASVNCELVTGELVSWTAEPPEEAVRVTVQPATSGSVASAQSRATPAAETVALSFAGDEGFVVSVAVTDLTLESFETLPERSTAATA